MTMIKGNLVTPGCSDNIGRGKYECGTTNFIQEVKGHSLKVHAFTFRNTVVSSCGALQLEPRPALRTDGADMTAAHNKFCRCVTRPEPKT